MNPKDKSIYISIIIPTFNRANTLRITLNSIDEQPDTEDFEVIIVDNGSKDETKKVCEDFVGRPRSKFRYFYDEEPGLLTGRHFGTSVARGEILGFIDDDVKLTFSWIAGVKDAFKNPTVQLATGPCLPEYSSDPPRWLPYFWTNVNGKGSSCSWLSLIDLGNRKTFIHPNYVWGLNFRIRKSAVLLLKGFHPDNIPSHLQIFQGDGETGLTRKAAQRNYKALYHPQIKLFHLISAERLTIKYFQKRAFYQGVCNSFTLLRNKYSKDKTGRKPVLKNLKSHVLLPFKKLLLFIKILSLPKEISEIFITLKKKEKDGYQFHQNAFKENYKVKEWVLKNNYWDYKLHIKYLIAYLSTLKFYF